ncbi:hypothetical protein ACWKWA_12250, partial [Dermacoccus abyssi]
MEDDDGSAGALEEEFGPRELEAAPSSSRTTPAATLAARPTSAAPGAPVVTRTPAPRAPAPPGAAA